MVISEKELQVVRISDLKMLGDFNSLFYEKQGVVAPGKWFGGSEEHGLVNDGKVFTIDVHSSPLGAAKFAYAKAGDYELAHLMTKNGTMSPLFFDTKSSKFCTVARGNSNLLYLKVTTSQNFLRLILIGTRFTPVFSTKGCGKAEKDTLLCRIKRRPKRVPSFTSI